MQIPSQIPDLQQPLTQRLEAAPVRPVAATPGVADQVKSLDPRVALQWTQPVFEQDALALAKAADASAKQLAGFQAASGSGLHPLLAQGLGSFLQARSLHIHQGQTPVWPELTSPLNNQPAQPLPQQVLQLLYQALVQSPVFAANQLMQVFQGKKPLDNAEEAIQRWAPALSPDHPAAEQATDMLLSGTMRWQGEWVNGIPLQIERRDAWRENTDAVGGLEKGAALHVQVDLPRLGRMTVLAQQWPGEAVQLQVGLGAQALAEAQAQSAPLQAWGQTHPVKLTWAVDPLHSEGD